MPFDQPSRSAKRSRPMRDPRSQPDRRHQFSSVTHDLSRAQKNDKPLRTIEAVEKPMDEEELQRYFSQYLSAVQEQREQSKSLTEKQLHALVMQLFRSLQYSNHQADGE
jgi:RNA-splicing ligase RtcB